jgi:CubicO group peptidase (beta-lactamase class C family)
MKINALFFVLLAVTAALFFPILLKAQGGADNNKWHLGDSIEEKRASALLQAIDKGDEASIRQFIGEQFAPGFREMVSMEEHVAQFQKIKRSLPEMRVAGVEMSRPNAVTVLLQVTGGKMMKLDVEVDAKPPKLISSIDVREAQKRSPALKFSSFDELDRQLQKMTDEDRFSGVVSVWEGDRAVFQKAYGMANREKRIPNRTDTLFDIGSVNKLFTAVSILRLAQDGKLKLDDNVGKYLKGFAPAVAEKVTIRQLLQHRSGLGDYLHSPEFNKDPKRFRTVGDYLELARAGALKFEPGTSQAYSNLGYVILGGIIEAVTGRSYYDAVKDFVYRPAEMKSTDSFEPGTDKNMAIGYTRMRRGEGKNPGEPQQQQQQPQPLIPNLKFFAPKGSPAGGGFSTAEDFKRFMDAVFANRLLNQEYTDLFLNRFDPPREPLNRSSVLAEGGGAEGVNAVIVTDPGKRQTVVVLANLDMPIAEKIGEAVFRQFSRNSATK